SQYWRASDMSADASVCLIDIGFCDIHGYCVTSHRRNVDVASWPQQDFSGRTARLQIRMCACGVTEAVGMPYMHIQGFGLDPFEQVVRPPQQLITLRHVIDTGGSRQKQGTVLRQR